MPGSVATSVDIPLSQQAKHVLEHASDEADRVNARGIGTEHLLLGLLRESDSLAAEILRSKGLKLEDVREEVRLQTRVKDLPPHPKEAFPKLVAFLTAVEQRRAACHVSAFRGRPRGGRGVLDVRIRGG
jgi:ATP-dependent Clp protease ATP-binding subunit ClpA